MDYDNIRKAVSVLNSSRWWFKWVFAVIEDPIDEERAIGFIPSYMEYSEVLSCYNLKCNMDGAQIGDAETIDEIISKLERVSDLLKGRTILPWLHYEGYSIILYDQDREVFRTNERRSFCKCLDELIFFISSQEAEHV